MSNRVCVAVLSQGNHASADPSKDPFASGIRPSLQRRSGRSKPRLGWKYVHVVFEQRAISSSFTKRLILCLRRQCRHRPKLSPTGLRPIASSIRSVTTLRRASTTCENRRLRCHRTTSAAFSHKTLILFTPPLRPTGDQGDDQAAK